jgi:hypothetical protein
VNELLEALRDLPVVDVPIRWPDPPDLDSEYLAALLVASPESADRIRATLEVLLGSAQGLRELVEALDEVAVRFGGDGDAETCSTLLHLSGSIRDWGDPR